MEVGSMSACHVVLDADHARLARLLPDPLRSVHAFALRDHAADHDRSESADAPRLVCVFTCPPHQLPLRRDVTPAPSADL